MAQQYLSNLVVDEFTSHHQRASRRKHQYVNGVSKIKRKSRSLKYVMQNPASFWDQRSQALIVYKV